MDACRLLDSLESTTSNKMVSDVTAAFSQHLQIVLDEFKNLSQENEKGKVAYANKYLLVQFINDILSGYHLASKGYSKQAFGVLRGPLETYDLLSLFKKDPSQVDFWFQGGHQAYKELKPAAVRRKLGKNSTDVMTIFYNSISEIGVHAGFRSSKNHVTFDIETKTASISVGGEVLEFGFLFASLFAFVLTLQLWSAINIVYRSQLNSDPGRVMKALGESMKNFLNLYPAFYDVKDKNGKSMMDITDELIRVMS